MIMNINEITWGALHNSIWLLLAVLVLVLLCYRYKKQRRIQNFLVGKHIQFLRNVSPPKQLFKCLLMATGFLFLCIALLRPQWSKTEETVTQTGRDVYIALDISRSMLAADCKPNRLVCAKEKIKQLLKKLSCERVGLILFSGSAFVQCPLTSDYAAFDLYLDAVDAELISSGTTALDQAIRQALTSFSAIPERKSKLLVLFTDGEDFSHNLNDIKQESVDAQLSIFTVGIGTVDGAPVPLLDEHGTLVGHQKNSQGGVVISRLNEGILRALSHDAGGSYIHVTDNDDDITALVRSVNSFDKEDLGERKVSRHEDQYHYFLLVSFICFALEWLL
jgi:Ca-activated chloride channel family protein